MTTTITLENASSDFLSAFKGLAKVANVNFKIKEVKKWEKEYPKEAAKIAKQVDREMGLA